MATVPAPIVQPQRSNAATKVVKKNPQTKKDATKKTETKMYATIDTKMAQIAKYAADGKKAHAAIKKLLKKLAKAEKKAEANKAQARADLLEAAKIIESSTKLIEAAKILGAQAPKSSWEDWGWFDSLAELKKADAQAPKSSAEDWWWFDGSWWIGCTGSDCDWWHKVVF